MYRVLKEEQQSRRRGRAQEPQARRRPPERVATRSNQVWSWEIAYLKTSIRGVYYYLYMVMDVWSRKIVAAAVHESESQELAAELIDGAARSEGIDLKGVFLHSDNGGPMKGMTMLSKLRTLGMVASFSRPATSNDNPYSEARREYRARGVGFVGQRRAANVFVMATRICSGLPWTALTRSLLLREHVVRASIGPVLWTAAVASLVALLAIFLGPNADFGGIARLAVAWDCSPPPIGVLHLKVEATQLTLEQFGTRHSFDLSDTTGLQTLLTSRKQADDPPVVIDVDDGVRYDVVVRVLDLLASLGLRVHELAGVCAGPSPR